MQVGREKKLLLSYVTISTMASAYNLMKLYERTPNFYVFGTLLPSNSLTLFLCTNAVVSWTILIGVILQHLVFGELRIIEVEHLYEKSWRSIMTLVVTGFTHMNTKNSIFLIIFGCLLLFLKAFHCLLSDRLDGIIQRYHSNTSEESGKFKNVVFNRILLCSSLIIRFDYMIIKWCIDESLMNKRYILLFIAFELFFETMQLINSLIKFGCNAWEIQYLMKHEDEDNWRFKVWIETISKFVINLITCASIGLMFTVFLMKGQVYFQLMTTSFYSVYDTFQSFHKIITLIRSQYKLKSILFTPTAEEIENADICIICRDDLVSGDNSKAIKLACGHILHENCVKSWLTMSKLCPTCRKDVYSVSNETKPKAQEPTRTEVQPPRLPPQQEHVRGDDLQDELENAYIPEQSSNVLMDETAPDLPAANVEEGEEDEPLNLRLPPHTQIPDGWSVIPLTVVDSEQGIFSIKDVEIN